MIILPTEKKFDWQHAPLIIILLVFLNGLIFFLYQSGDSGKIETAYSLYEESELLTIEWPLYRDFLQQNDQAENALDFQSLMDEQYFGDVSYAILTDYGFSQHLKQNYREVVPDGDYNEWSDARPEINRLIDSVSFYNFGLIPSDIGVFQLISYQFLHGDIMHLLGNLFFLVVCGFAVEAAIGHLKFVIFYLVTGIVGGLTHAFIDLDSSGPLVGASGAISGVMAMYLGVFRLKKIEFFYWLFIFVGYFRAPALLILPIYIGNELYSFYSSDGSGVAFLAHAGGFVAGGLLIFISLIINPKTINEEYVEEDQNTDAHQEKLAKVYTAIENFQFVTALKTIDDIIREDGISFDLAFLRYNLSKLDKPSQFGEWVTNLLLLNTREAKDLSKLQLVWNENPEIASNLADDKQLELGFRFSNKQQFETAEKIFKLIYKKQPKHPQLSLLARNLSAVAKEMHESKKQAAYEQFANASQGAHG